MITTIYPNAKDFLAITQPVLQENEAVNNLMLGLCLRMVRQGEPIDPQPLFATVCQQQEVIVASVMTPPHNLVLYSSRLDCTTALETLAKRLLEDNWMVPGVIGPVGVVERYGEISSGLSGRGWRVEMRQRIYELRKVFPPSPAPGHLRLAAEIDLPLVAQWMLAFHREALGENEPPLDAENVARERIQNQQIYLWEDGSPVSMAASSRPTLNGTTVNMVFTPPELRRRGYASNCVASLSQLLLDSGYQFCALYTDLANPTSNDIYVRIGYTPIADSIFIKFGA